MIIDVESRADLQSTPMPSLPCLVPPSFPDAPEGEVIAQLQGAVFVPLTAGMKTTREEANKLLDSVGVVLIYRDSSELSESLCF